MDLTANFGATKLPLIVDALMPTFSTIGFQLVKIRSVLPLIPLFGLILHSNFAVSQQSLSISKVKGAVIFGGLTIHSLVNLKLDNNISANEIHYWKIRGIDRMVPLQFIPAHAQTSDSTFATAGLLVTKNLWMTWNITQTSKMIARRAWPYANEIGFSAEKKTMRTVSSQPHLAHSLLGCQSSFL